MTLLESVTFYAAWILPLAFYAAMIYLVVLAARFVRAAERLARSQEEAAKAQRDAAEALELLALRRSQS